MQLIKYNWIDWEPFFIAREGDAQFKLKLLGQHFNIALGEKFCTGFVRDSRHYPCPDQRKIDYGSNCAACRSEDWFSLCMACTGDVCINPKRREDCKTEHYYMYLAAFDGVLKVGISHESRLLKRLVEQGADMGAKIGYLQDGKDVREAEQRVKELLKVTDRMRGDQKHSLLFGSPNKAAPSLRTAIAVLRDQNFPWLIKPEIYDLRDYYRLHTVVKQPTYLQIKEHAAIAGSVVAAKGNLVVFRTAEGFLTLNAHDMIGRSITFLTNGF
ncbi:MAG: DUF2797 domain-containing protein [Candidatus Aenigmarchaeota archaeon]|nr:DUF2797 domain-containing protein [Candidatus Aenigmarchaeota archaeon]